MTKHTANHVQVTRSDLGDEKRYCVDCGRYLEPVRIEESVTPIKNKYALHEANAAYARALKENQSYFNLMIFVAASLVILGIMSKVLG